MPVDPTIMTSPGERGARSESPSSLSWAAIQSKPVWSWCALLLGFGGIGWSVYGLQSALAATSGPASDAVAAWFPLIFASVLIGSLIAAYALYRLHARNRKLDNCNRVQTDHSHHLSSRLEAILCGAEQVFWDWNIQSGEIWFSSQIARLIPLAGRKEAGIWRGIDDLRAHVHEDDVQRFEGAILVRSQTGDFAPIEYRVRTECGDYRWFRDTGRIVDWSDDGAPRRAAGTLTDITEDRRKCRELDLNRELLQRAEAIAHVGGWKWEIASRRLFWTEQVFRIHELPMTFRPDVDVSMTFFDVDSRRELSRAGKAARENGTPFDLELAFTTANGRPLWVRAIGEPYYEGDKIAGLHGTFQDISERKRFELALQESEQRYKLAVESAADGIWDWNIATGKMVHNESWNLMIDANPSETTTTFDQWMAMVHPEDESRVRAVLKAYLDDKTPRFESRHRMRTRSGEWKWILTRGKVVSRDPSGNARRMTGTHKDVSFDKEVEDQLRAARSAAEAATRAKTEFLANMSHEIRTPMTAILGFSEHLLDSALDDKERRHALHTIRRNGEHLLHIINDILDLSKIEAGRMTVERIYSSPAQIACEVVELLKVRAADKGLELSLELDGPVPRVIQTDPTRFRQILMNIVGNAIKFTETGSIRVVMRIVSGEQPSMLQVDVIDTGIGMSRKEVAGLFKAFTQADTTVTRRFGGTGLGLVISQRLATMLGGAIRVESKPAKGAHFTIDVETGDIDGIPFIDSIEQIADAVKLSTTSPVNTPIDARILIAEDGPDNQRLLRMILGKVGAKLVIAENGREAMRMIEARREADAPFDVVLMDMQMPVLDGYEATRQLREKGFDRPIIALTAHSMRGDRERCIAAGCDDYLTKPIRREQLFECIRKHLDARSEPSVSA